MSLTLNLVVDYPYVIISGVSAIDHTVMSSVASKLMEMYDQSGEHIDVPNENGSVNRKIIKPYSSSLYDLHCIAEKTANHMKGNNLGQVDSIFSFSLKPIVLPEKNSEFILKKGTPVRSTHPSYANRKSIPIARDQKVVLHSVSKGHYNDYKAEDGIGWNSGRLTWAGTGGYWKWVDV